jgi:hypothetical protein
MATSHFEQFLLEATVPDAGRTGLPIRSIEKLRPPRNGFSPGCITDSDPTMAKGTGTAFTIVDVGGESFYDVNNNDSEAGYFITWSSGNRDQAYGTLDVTATADQLSAVRPGQGLHLHGCLHHGAALTRLRSTPWWR